MNTLTKMALGLIGQLKPTPLAFDPGQSIHLPAPTVVGGMPLMQALGARQSQRDFQPAPLPEQTLSDLLWAAAGINRAELGGRTAPSAMNAQEVDVYVALATGLYRYAPKVHELHLVAAMDVRRVTGYQDFVDTSTAGPGVRGGPRPHEDDSGRAPRIVCVHDCGCHGTKRLSVLRFGRAGGCGARLV